MTAFADKKRILVVEDDPEMIAVHQQFLSDCYMVIHKPNGKNTLRYLKENRDIHLAIIDYRLPDISGIEVLKELKKSMPLTPAIFITGHGSEDIAVNAFRCGARDYIKKPFAYDELLRRIALYLPLNTAAGEVRERTAVMNEPEEFAGGTIRGTDTAKKSYSIQQACKYIQSDYSTDVTLNQAASAAGISKYHFSRTFKEATGSTFQSYLNRVRIENAKHLLSNNRLSITDVGYAVGYGELRQFERIFKKVVGATPTEYRKSNSAGSKD